MHHSSVAAIVLVDKDLNTKDRIVEWERRMNLCGGVEILPFLDETYENVEEIPVMPITKTEIPKTLKSPAREVDIVNVGLPNIEKEDESAQEEENSEDNDSASANSISTQDDETYDSGERGRGKRDQGRGTGGRRGRPRKRTSIPLDLGEAEAETLIPPATSIPVIPTPSLSEGLPAMRMILTPGLRV
ncbi:hypothetical protein PIB30_030783 [Stylosanthes scabra]|uniref:Uncharacterized protein n=1 Tax=Stylosanthes scabra TaxID=79078 RepID=A0ABU6ZBS3_9FABA|nr:hypothetical protein [Stylosanthes scabra]